MSVTLTSMPKIGARSQKRTWPTTDIQTLRTL